MSKITLIYVTRGILCRQSFHILTQNHMVHTYSTYMYIVAINHKGFT